MSREYANYHRLRERNQIARGPLSQAAFSMRRYLSRMSLVDFAAVVLIWGNLIGLIAYPALGHFRVSAKSAQSVPEIKQVSHTS